MFALVVRFDLLPGTEDEFDWLAETGAGIRAEEPGTLLYLCHTVPGEPSARVFYELLRSRRVRGPGAAARACQAVPH